jgi:hypothetical protein
MTDLPAHQILYDLQYARGGEGDERKYVNVTDIAGPHADALLAQIERDQIEREQLRLRQHQPPPPPIPMITSMNEMPPAIYPLGFDRQHTQILQQQQQPYPMAQPSYPLGFDQQHAQVLHQQQQQQSGFYDANELQQKTELILERRRQREQEEKQAERLAFGTNDDDRSHRRVSYEPHVQTYEPDENVCIVLNRIFFSFVSFRMFLLNI